MGNSFALYSCETQASLLHYHHYYAKSMNAAITVDSATVADERAAVAIAPLSARGVGDTPSIVFGGEFSRGACEGNGEGRGRATTMTGAFEGAARGAAGAIHVARK